MPQKCISFIQWTRVMREGQITQRKITYILRRNEDEAIRYDSFTYPTKLAAVYVLCVCVYDEYLVFQLVRSAFVGTQNGSVDNYTMGIDIICSDAVSKTPIQAMI